MSVLAHLEVISGAPEEKYSLKAGVNSVGRLAENDVCIPDASGLLSRRHCSIDIEHGKVKIRDLGSGKVQSLPKMIPHELHDGQEIELGGGMARRGGKEGIKCRLLFGEELKASAAAPAAGEATPPLSPESTPPQSPKAAHSDHEHRRRLESRKTVVLRADEVRALEEAAEAEAAADEEEERKEQEKEAEREAERQREREKEEQDPEKLELIANIVKLQLAINVQPSNEDILKKKPKVVLADQLKTLQVMQESQNALELKKLAAAERRRSKDVTHGDAAVDIGALTDALNRVSELEDQLRLAEQQKQRFKETAEEYSESIEHWEKRYNDMIRTKDDKIEALEHELRTASSVIDSTAAQLKSLQAELVQAGEQRQRLEEENAKVSKDRLALDKKMRELKSLAAELTKLANE